MVAEIILVAQGSEQAEPAKQSAQYVAHSLSDMGFQVREQISMCESVAQLQQAVSAALGRSHILAVLGGMGYQSGYLAKNTLSQGLGLPLEPNHEIHAAIRSYCHRTGEPYSAEEDEGLSLLPQGSVAFPGSHGKIPGCVISSTKQHIILLPENNDEIAPMFSRYVSPYLGGAASTTVTRTVRTYGISQAAVRERLGSLLQSSNPAVTVLQEHNEVLIQVVANSESGGQAAALCTPILRTIVGKMGDAAYGLDVDSLQSALIAKLNKKELDIAIVEAGTDGMLTRVLGETEGGRDLICYSVLAEDDEAKIRQLGMDSKQLKKRGSISEYTTVAMADAARRKVHSGIGVAICAVTDDTATKKMPAGLVYIAVCNAEFVYIKKLIIGDGTAPQDVIIDASLSRALNMMRLFVDYLPRRYSGAIPLLEALDGKSVTTKAHYDAPLDTADEQPEKPKSGGIVRKFIFTLAILIFVSSAGYIGYTFYQSYANQKMTDQLNSMFQFGDMDIDPGDIPEDYPSDYSLRFLNLWKVNPDVKAFINIPGTSVQYPIVQSTGDINEYYLRRDFYKENNQHGVPFFDFRVDVQAPSDSLVVYGHNMTDGQIFGELVKYKDLDYYKEHPVIDFSTVYEDTQYKVFSVFITNAYPNQGHVFDYFNFIDAENEGQFSSFLEQLQYRTMITTTVDAQPGDQLLLLSTCSYEFNDMRTVIVARKLRKGEKATVDVNSAALTPHPLYPDIAYQKWGGTPPEGIDRYWTVGPNASNYNSGGGGAPAVSAMAYTPRAVSSSSQEESASSAAQVEQSRKAEEESSKAAAAAESSRQAEESKAAAAEASRKEVEASQMAVSQAAVDKLRAEEMRLAEESRQAEERRAEEERLAEESRQEAERKAEDERLAEESRQEAERLAEEKRLAREAQQPKAEPMSVSFPTVGQMTVVANGSRITQDAVDIIAGVVQNEVGASFNTEAIKAQAVAAYTFLNQSGGTPSVALSTKVDSRVRDAVSQVIGEAVYYKGKLAFTPYHATSAGATTSSASVWGGSYPYLVSVDSSVDQKANGYKVSTTLSRSKVEELLSARMGIQPEGDPADWFEVLSYTDGDYINEMSVCGYVKSPKSGSKITGRMVRETVLNLRSANFTVDYNAGSDKFTFTTYGYGHGVGMSQTGANAYAAQGWSYVEILEHYYPGTSVG